MRATQRAVSNGHRRAEATKVRRGQRGHRTGPHHERVASVEVVNPHRIQGLADGEGHHRRAFVVNIGLGMNAFASAQRTMRQFVQPVPDGAILCGACVRVANLANNLLLPHNHGVQTSSNAEHVFHGGLGVSHV